MKKTISNKNEFLKVIRKNGNRKMFLAEDPITSLAYLMISSDYIQDPNSQYIQCHILDLVDNIRGITTFALAIKLPNNEIYISFIDFKKAKETKLLYDIISKDKINLRIINDKDDYFLSFNNPSKKDFLDLFNKISLEVKEQHYTSADYSNFISSICNTYTNEELLEIWADENK